MIDIVKNLISDLQISLIIHPLFIILRTYVAKAKFFFFLNEPVNNKSFYYRIGYLITQ